MSLDIFERKDVSAAYKSNGAMEYALEQIAAGKLNKAQCVAMAKRTLELVQKFEKERVA